jgi:hypothetical protein
VAVWTRPYEGQLKPMNQLKKAGWEAALADWTGQEWGGGCVVRQLALVVLRPP